MKNVFKESEQKYIEKRTYGCI